MRVIYLIPLLSTKDQVLNFQGQHKNTFQLIFEAHPNVNFSSGKPSRVTDQTALHKEKKQKQYRFILG